MHNDVGKMFVCALLNLVSTVGGGGGGSCGLVSCKTNTPLFSPNPHSSVGTSTSRSQTNAVVADAYFPDQSTPKDFVVSIDPAQINMDHLTIHVECR